MGRFGQSVLRRVSCAFGGGLLSLAMVARTLAQAQAQPQPQPQPQAPPALAVQPASVQFIPGPQFARAVSQRATGLFRLGTSRFDRREALTYALLSRGEVLQLETRAAGQWLARLPGSRGGGNLPATQFDRLLLLTAGADVDISKLPASQQQQFQVLAGLVTVSPLALSITASLPPLTLQCVGLAGAVPCAPGTPADTRAFDRSLLGPRCGQIGCEAYYSMLDGDSLRLRIEHDPQTGRWGVVGGGVVAIWPLPPAM